MITRVYLDQNIISSLREGIDQKQEWVNPLKSSLLDNKFQILYSSTTLDEIDLVDFNSEKTKFLNVLDFLGANFCYIYENTEDIGEDKRSAFEIWQDYCAHKNILKESGATDMIEGAIDFLKIAAGCNVGKDLLEGISDLTGSINNLISHADGQLSNHYHLLDNHFKVLMEKPIQITAARDTQSKGIDHRQLHPENIRRSPDVKRLKIKNTLTPETIIDKISPHIEPWMIGANMRDKVRIIYQSLNILGFNNDDYTSSGGERLMASINDMNHVVNSAFLEIFITSDAKLRIKAKAIYYALQLDTKVYSPEEFLTL